MENRYIVVRRSIMGADTIAFHVIDTVTGEELVRALFEEDAEDYARKLNRKIPIIKGE